MNLYKQTIKAWDDVTEFNSPEYCYAMKLEAKLAGELQDSIDLYVGGLLSASDLVRDIILISKRD